jgi:putative metallohydrolase (TIGR04338 family)
MGKGQVVDFHGQRLVVGDDITYSRPQDAQFMIDMLWAAEMGTTDSPKVRVRKGDRKAVYEKGPHTIAIPDAQWALSAFTAIHELAHAITWRRNPSVAGHGPEFARIYADLVYRYLDPTAGLMLSDGFRAEGLL